MEAWMAFVSIMAIAAIVVVGGGLITFIAHMVLGVFDNKKPSIKQDNKEILDYAQYKQLETSKVKTVEKDYDFEAINRVKAQKEREMLEKEQTGIFDLQEDDNLKEIENRLKEQKVDKKPEKSVEDIQPKVEIKPEQPKVQTIDDNEVDASDDLDDDIDDFDFDNMLNEISNDVIEEEMTQMDNDVKMSDELASYNIDDILNETTEDFEDDDFLDDDFDIPVEPIEEVKPEPIKPEPVKPKTVVTNQVVKVNNPVQRKVDSKALPLYATIEQPKVQEKPKAKEKYVAIPFEAESKHELATYEIEALKRQLAAVNKQLEEARNGNRHLEELNKKLEEAKNEQVEVIRIDMTEDECVNRIQTLEDRLKSVKKDYKANAKEYRPLRKVMNDLEHYQTKLRRKEAVVAKKKVALYGVNNYVDIDKEKAEKLANELELLDGLRLSVSHCEELIEANKDRFPVLEHTNQILEDQIAHIEADLETYREMLRKIRERNGNGEGNKGEGSNE